MRALYCLANSLKSTDLKRIELTKLLNSTAGLRSEYAIIRRTFLKPGEYLGDSYFSGRFGGEGQQFDLRYDFNGRPDRDGVTRFSAFMAIDNSNGRNATQP